jgi:hypothetical protein
VGAGYNIVAIPLAAGVLAPQGVVLHPAGGAVLMSASRVVVAFVPLVGVGLVPLVEWTVLPLLVVWFVRRQLRGAAVAAGRDPVC